MELNTEDFKKASDAMVQGTKALSEMQARHTELEGKIVGQDDTIVKLQGVVADSIQKAQDIELKAKTQFDALTARNDLLEKQIARGVGVGVANDSQFHKDFNGQLNRFLKRQIPIDRELIEKMAEQITEKTIVSGEADKYASYKKDMVEGSNPTGGYWVIPERSSQVITRNWETTPWRMVANVISTSSNQVDMIIDDEESGYGTTNEVATQTKTTTPTIGLLSIPVNELYVSQYASQWMLEDAGFDLAGYLNNKGVAKLERVQNTAFVNGTGVGGAKGYLTYADNDVNTTQSYVRGQIYTRTTAGSLVIASNDLKFMQADIKEVYQPNSVWMMSRQTFGTITTLKDGAGQYIFNNFYMQDKPVMNLLGKKVLFAPDLGDAVTAGAYPVIYGDFGAGYTIVDRIGNRFLRDPFTAHPFTIFRIGNRYGGAVTSYDSTVRLKVKS